METNLEGGVEGTRLELGEGLIAAFDATGLYRQRQIQIMVRDSGGVDTAFDATRYTDLPFSLQGTLLVTPPHTLHPC